MKDKQSNDLPLENQRFIEVWDELKKQEEWKSDSAFLKGLGVKSRTVISEIRGGRPVPSSILEILADEHNVNTSYIRRGKLPKYKELDTNISTNSNTNTASPGEALRLAKAIGASEDEGLIAVPIGAQAGGEKYYDDPVYSDQLERIKIPFNPFKGDRYRFFQVDGDSMEKYSEGNRPTGLPNGMWVVAERIDQEDWTQIDNYYVYVIVEARRIRIKRLFMDPADKSGFVVISDNPDWEQEWLWLKEVKELWQVKRKMDWDMSPPQRFEIKIKPPKE